MNYFYKGVLYYTSLNLKASLNIYLRVNVCAFLKERQEGGRERRGREREKKREREKQKGKKIKHMGTTS